jgi:putative addiction module killer protein
MWEVREYVRPDGHCPFVAWVDSLNDHAAAKVLTAIQRMKNGNLGDHKSVGGGVSERRIDYGPGYRVYFARDGERIVILLGGGSKARQQADIKSAQSCWAAYKTERKG